MAQPPPDPGPATQLRAALTEQYSALAGALAQLAGRLGQAGLPDPRREGKVAQLFMGLGLDALECSVTSDLAGRLTVAVTIARTRFTEEEVTELTGEVSRICRRDLDLPEITHCRTVTMLSFGERPVFRAEFGAAAARPKGRRSAAMPWNNSVIPAAVPRCCCATVWGPAVRRRWTARWQPG